MNQHHLGHHDASAALVEASHAVLAEGGPLTPDLGGVTATSDNMAAAIAEHAASGS